MDIEVIDDRAGEEFLHYTQFWDPHDPYNRTDEQVDRFRDGPLPPYPTEEQIADHQDWNAFRSANDPGLQRSLQHGDYPEGVTGRDALGELLAHYDVEIRYTDEHVGRLLDALRENDLYDETLIVVTGDHGEEFGEHGLYREHWSTHDGTQRVPMVIKPPADTPVDPGVRDHLVTNVDLAPTITDYLGVDPPERWQGRSLRPIVESDDADGFALCHVLRLLACLRGQLRLPILEQLRWEISRNSTGFGLNFGETCVEF
jgi:arylsulfatase A-like enzyme